MKYHFYVASVVKWFGFLLFDFLFSIFFFVLFSLFVCLLFSISLFLNRDYFPKPTTKTEIHSIQLCMFVSTCGIIVNAFAIAIAIVYHIYVV